MTERIETEDELERALTGEAFLLFKHSRTCPTSVTAFDEYEAWAADAPVPTGWIEVVQQRPFARAVAERTGVRHESPQALFLVAGEVRWHASHGAITRASLEAAVGARARG